MAERLRDWLAVVAVPARAAVIVLPFVELLQPCRRALALAGGWMPRVETLRTLAAALGPPLSGSPESASGDRAIDQLLAQRLLLGLPGLREWRRRDVAAFAQATQEVVQATHALARAAQAVPPPEREAWWDRAERAWPRDDGPGAMDLALGRLAAQWARQDGEAATDALFDAPVSAWIVLQAGGADPLAEALLADAVARGTPALRLLADAPVGTDPFAHHVQAAPRLYSVASAEDEAWATAGLALAAIEAGELPVALIAQDRLVVRRIRALLERRGVRLADESGWALSTTRAASHLMALLNATRAGAGPDAWLDGLKAHVGAASSPALDALERRWRRHGAPGHWPREATDGLPREAIDGLPGGSTDIPPVERAVAGDADARWAALGRRWQAFAEPGERTLAEWLVALAHLADDMLPANFWRHDPVAERVRAALRLEAGSVRNDIDAWPLRHADFIAWVEQVLEQATYIDPEPVESAQVVITPLARAMLRPFGQVLLPGADARQLGHAPPPPALLPEALLRALGMDDRAQRQTRAALAFAQLLRHPRLALVRRRAEGSEPVGPSLWTARLQSQRLLQALPVLAEQALAPVTESVAARPVAMPTPVAAGALPEWVSASAVEALRGCPYRFFARSVLGLSEVEELEADPGKRDFGTLLHEALHDFHRARDSGMALAGQAAQLVAAARAAATRSGLDAPVMLPFVAGLEDFARRYLAWQTERDAQGWQFEVGEIDKRWPADDAQRPGLRGRIDRIDRQPQGARQLIDYKTGSATTLRSKLRDPLEDTQLAFYAAQLLLAGEATEALSALYLALDDRSGIDEVPHPEVLQSARALLDGLARDWQALAGGEPLRALGEGALCDTCEVRGLCRRDHWADASDAAAVAAPPAEPMA